MTVPSYNPFLGSWTYRSLFNEPNINEEFNQLEFGRAKLIIDKPPAEEPGYFELLTGTIGGDDWSLDLHGSRTYASPMQARFQGKGIVNNEEWIYDYIAWLVPRWPNSDSTLQQTAMVGSVVRTIPHSSSAGGVSPAGVVGSFYAVRQKDK